MRRTAGFALAIVAAFALNMPAASAAATALPPSTQGCTDLFNTGGNAGNATLVKRITAVTSSNGSTTITFTLTSSRPGSELAQVTRIRDCAFIDLDNDRVRDNNEQVFSFDLRINAGSFVNGAEYSVTIAAGSSATICDRAAISSDGSFLNAGFTDKSTNPDGSQVACTGEPTEIPAGAIGGLGLAGLLGLLFVGYQVRTSRAARRRTAETPAL